MALELVASRSSRLARFSAALLTRKRGYVTDPSAIGRWRKVRSTMAVRQRQSAPGWPYLDVGAYGSDDPVRARLVGIARARACRKYQTRFDGKATVLVGDTPGDVQAALEGGARVIAVASGRNTAEELRRGPGSRLGDARPAPGITR